MLASERPETGEGQPRGGGARTAARLWHGLACAALTVEAGEEDTAVVDPTVVAAAINNHPAAGAYDGEIVGHLLRLAAELRRDRSAEAAPVRRRVGRLLTSLSRPTLARFLALGGSSVQRREFVLDAAEAFPSDAVRHVVLAAADVSHQVLSEPLVELLEKLSTAACTGTAAVRRSAEPMVREQVRQLVARWWLPGAHEGAIQANSAQAPADGRVAAPPAAQMVQLCLELGMAGVAVWSPVSELVEAGRSRDLLAMLREAPAGNRVAEAIGRHLATPARLRELLEEEPVDFDGLDRILEPLGLGAARLLLDALAASTSRSTRRGLFDRLARMGAPAGPMVVERLQDGPWFVQRNLLALLNEMAYWPDRISPQPYFEHADPRVRHEAVKLLLKVPARRDEALCAALKDDDPRMVRLGILSAREHFPDRAVPLVVKCVSDDALPAELRVLAIRLLRHSPTGLAREALLRLASGGKTLFGKQKLAAKSAEMLAALSGLAAAWRSHAPAAELLALAGRSKDAAVRAAAGVEG